MNREPDWSLWRSFLAVLDKGSLSAAARHLNVSQPTVGRHIETLETDLGLALFERSLSGLVPNQAALRLSEPVRKAHHALAEAAIIAEGTQSNLGGSVRISASVVISNHVLPGLLRPVRERYPDVALEFVSSDSTDNLLLREADIAIRMFRPNQLDLVTRHLGDIPIVPAAHQSYLSRRGTPRSMAEMSQHALIGNDRFDYIIRGAAFMGMQVKREDFMLRTDDQTQMWALLEAGLGIGFAQRNLVRMTPGMVELPLDLPIPPLPVWLTTHRELFTSVRIRAIYDALADGLVRYIQDSTI